MKKLLSILGIYFVLVGYTFPSDAPYIVVNSNRGNNESIYFASNMVQYLHVTNTSVLSSYSGNLVGYGSSGTSYTWTAYDYPTYRDGYQSYILGITKVVENHLYPNERSIINKNYELYILAIMGGIACICFLKK